MMNKGKKVFVGMSGGVDSSVSAALLVEQGYDVTGVFIKVWQPDFIECTWKEDRLDAMRVASQLGIPFVTLDLEKEYKQGVIDYMIEEYRVGRTPNPDVMCNREVKFGAFWKWAKAAGGDYIATGHYATVKEIGNANTFSLMKSKDENKDQTYFLWMLTKDDLEHVLFPIGHMEKDDVRKEAEKRGLYTSNKKDSQGLCFVGTIDVKTLLKEYIKEEKGDTINEKGEVIGSHDGVMFYTIGERHGFTVTTKGTDDAPYYVIGKDFEKNILVVSHNKPNTEDGRSIQLEKVSFVNEQPQEGKVYEARGRYRAPLAKVKAHKQKGGWEIEVLDGEIIKTSGQSLVLYDGKKCLGGGVMK
jgi:tRNA-specific 2-thiouridylase